MKPVQQRNALNVIYSPLRSATTRRLSLHFNLLARWRLLAAPQAHPRSTLRCPSSDTMGATPPYAISIPHSNPFAADGYINGGRWPVTCQTCIDTRCSCSCSCKCECGFMRTRGYPVYCRDYGASLSLPMISLRDWACKLAESVRGAIGMLVYQKEM